MASSFDSRHKRTSDAPEFGMSQESFSKQKATSKATRKWNDELYESGHEERQRAKQARAERLAAKKRFSDPDMWGI